MIFGLMSHLLVMAPTVIAVFFFLNNERVFSHRAIMFWTNGFGDISPKRTLRKMENII